MTHEMEQFVDAVTRFTELTKVVAMAPFAVLAVSLGMTGLVTLWVTRGR